MQIETLQLTDFRNYKQQKVHFDPSLNILLGENAQGKTNVLEAIYLLAVGKSHRTSRDQDLMRWGEESGAVAANINKLGRSQTMAVYFGNKGKRAVLNGITQTKMTDFVGHFQVVLFAPEDLHLVKGSPSVRRRFIDMELGQIQIKYLYHLSQYQRVLQQRNTLLKQEETDFDFLGVLDEQLVEHGTEVVTRRYAFVNELGEFAQSIYKSIASGREALDLHYHCSISSINSQQQPTRETIAGLFLKSLKEKQRTDKLQGYTSVGPHRDDLVFQLNEQSVQSFASQGQQRSIALALRLAEIDFIYRELNDYPVLLLDDVLSELDDIRQTNLVLSMREKVQTIITTTSIFQLQDKLGQQARFLNVHSGIIHTEG